jgi:hypothetical protein
MLFFLERLVRQLKLGDTEITGLADKHQCQATPDDKSDRTSSDVGCPPNNVSDGIMRFRSLRTGGLRIALWGDNRGVPDPVLDQHLKNVDALILPVDTVLTRPEVDAIVRKYDPKAIIPAHYFVEGLTTVASGLESAESWVSDQEKNRHADVRRLDRADLTLNPIEIKRCDHRVYYFGNHFEKAIGIDKRSPISIQLGSLSPGSGESEEFAPIHDVFCRGTGFEEQEFEGKNRSAILEAKP